MIQLREGWVSEVLRRRRKVDERQSQDSELFERRKVSTKTGMNGEKNGTNEHATDRVATAVRDESRRLGVQVAHSNEHPNTQSSEAEHLRRDRPRELGEFVPQSSGGGLGGELRGEGKGDGVRAGVKEPGREGGGENRGGKDSGNGFLVALTAQEDAVS